MPYSRMRVHEDRQPQWGGASMIASRGWSLNRRVFVCSAALLAGSLAPALGQQAAEPQPGRTYHVGFSQIVDHPALNETRRGLIDGLAKAGFVQGKNLAF